MILVKLSPHNKYHIIFPKTIKENPIIGVEIHDGEVFDLNLNSFQENIKYWSSLDATLININNLTELCKCVKFFEIDLNYKKG